MNVISIKHSRNFGSQAAFVSGMEIATGDAVVLMDGDLQDPPELIPLFFEQWQKGYEVVYGRRIKRGKIFVPTGVHVRKNRSLVFGFCQTLSCG